MKDVVKSSPAASSASRADRDDMEEVLLLAVLTDTDMSDEEEAVEVENEVASFEEESSLLISVMVAVDSEDGCRIGGNRCRSKPAG